MKKLLPYGFALLAFSAPAFAAAHDMSSHAASATLQDAIGQPLYDSHDIQVGVIRGTTTETGQPSAIVSIKGLGHHEVLVTADSLQPRNSGGWLTALTSDSIARMQPYVPGRMPPA
jgi:hypothetical protein